jgi:lipoate-protein ligase A
VDLDYCRSDEWLYAKGGLRPTGVKIHEDVRVFEGATKAHGGLIRATVRLREGQIDGLGLSGDFTLFPAAATGTLEAAANGAEMTRDALAERFAATYHDLDIQSPGITPEQRAGAVLAAASR